MKKLFSIVLLLIISQHIYAQVEHPRPSILQTGKVYYLYNSGSKGFLVGGNSWKVQASIDFDHAYKVKVEKHIGETGKWDGITYYITDSVETYETEKSYVNVFIETSGDIYVDQAENGRTKTRDNLWTIKPTAGNNGFYQITPSPHNKTFNSQKQVLSVSNVSKTKMPVVYLSENTMSRNSEWCFVDTLDAYDYFKRKKNEEKRVAEQRKKEIREGLGNDTIPTGQVVYMYCPDYDGFLVGENQYKAMASLSKNDAFKVIIHKYYDETGRWDGESYIIADSVESGNYAGAYRNIFVEKDGVVWVDQQAETSHFDNKWKIRCSPAQNNAFKILLSDKNVIFTNANLPGFCLGVSENDISSFPIVGLIKDTISFFSDWYFLTPQQREILYLKQRRFQLEDLCKQVSNSFPEVNVSWTYDICHNASSELSEIECAIGKMRQILLSNGKTETTTDFTNLIVNSKFNEEAGFGWHSAYDVSVGRITWKGGVDFTDIDKVAPNPCAEAYQSIYDFSQKINGVPKGLYRVDAQAFSRTRIQDLAWIERDSSLIVPVLYANDMELPVNNLVHTIFPDTLDGNSYLTRNYNGNDGAWQTMDGHYILNNHRTASISFDRGLFDQSIYCIADSGIIRIGIKESYRRTGAWTVWDNFRITYLPESKKNYETAIKCHLVKARDTEMLAKLKGVDVGQLSMVISEAEHVSERDEVTRLRELFFRLNQEMKDVRHLLAIQEFGDDDRIYYSYSQLSEEEESEEEKLRRDKRNVERVSIEKSRDEADSYYCIGNFVRDCDIDLALKHFRKAFSLYVNLPSYYSTNIEACANMLSLIYKEKEQYDDAIDVLRKNADVYSKSTWNSGREGMAMDYREIGHLYFFKKEEYYKAEESYKKATAIIEMLYDNACKLKNMDSIIKYKQLLPEYLNDLSYSRAYQKKYEEALETINRAVELQPDEANYYDSKGEILYMSGDKEGAKTMWEKVVSLDPDFAEKNNSQLYQYLFGNK